MPRKKRKKNKKSTARQPTSAPQQSTGVAANHSAEPASKATAQASLATLAAPGDGCGEDVGDYGEVVIRKDGSTQLHYDSGGVPWFMYVAFGGFLIFAVAYCATYLIDFS